MEFRGSQTEAPRALLPHDPRAGSVMWTVTLLMAVLFAGGHVLIVLAAAPAAIAFHGQVGTLPWFVAFAKSAGWFGMFVALTIYDIIILAGSVWMARRHWVGFAFLPPVLYLGSAAIMLWLLLGEAVKWVIVNR
jgi:hypothetical protein